MNLRHVELNPFIFLGETGNNPESVNDDATKSPGGFDHIQLQDFEYYETEVEEDDDWYYNPEKRLDAEGDFPLY